MALLVMCRDDTSNDPGDIDGDVVLDDDNGDSDGDVEIYDDDGDRDTGDAEMTMMMILMVMYF